jgi:DNA polymerase I-like protein with 3'-5' exonuclease and polymerase domains
MYKDLSTYIRMEWAFARICSEINENGINFESEKCHQFIKILKGLIEEIDIQLKPLIPHIKKKLPPLKSKSHIDKWISSGGIYKQLPDGSIERWVEQAPNLNSINVIRDYLLFIGWEPSQSPDAWNYKTIKTPWGKLEKLKDSDNKPIRTTPKIPNNDLELEKLSIISPTFRLVSKRIQINHRLHSMEGFLKNVRPDGRIPMVINPVGASTMRVTHSVVANVPRIGSYFGSEIKSLFSAPKGRVLVGADASGLELRTIAHDINDKDFTNLVLTGDIHNYIYDKISNYVSGRDSGKNTTYALLYGAGDSKLGSMCDIKKGNVLKIGKELRKRYEEVIPNLKKVTDGLIEQYEKYGGILGIDGRFIRCRNKYALLNTRGQSTGAILCKYWTVLYRKEIEKLGLDSKHIIFYHDDNTEETTLELADQVGKIMVANLESAGVYLKLNVPVTAGYKIGNNWGEIH